MIPALSRKKDPKKMFTDSSFYNSKYHPTIADQVEMAHKLSSAMFNEQNKGTKGAKMYLTRMENSGGFGDEVPKHDNVPNMKLVMNPEGKVHVWDDLPPEQRPDMGQLATHAVPNLSLPDVADPVAESLQAGVGRGGELFNKRKQKADSWIVDESTIGRINPGAVADKFIQEQSQQQLATQQQKQFEQQQKQQIQHEQLAAKEADQLQQQREAQQTFMQEQSMEVRRIQEMAQQQIDFPQDFQHTSLKARSYTPSLDLGCHNVQGINVWTNTAPRGWGSSRTGATPTRGAVVTPGPGLPGASDGDMMARMEETRLREEEERRLMEQEKLRMEEEQRLETVRIQQQQEEQIRLKQEREEQMRREQEEMMRQEEERRRLEQEKIQLEEERRRLEEERFRQEELRRHEEMSRQQEEMKRQEEERLRQEEERQRQQQMLMQQQQEKMILQQQREQMQQQEQMQMQHQQQQEKMILQQQREQMQQQQREQM